MNMTLRPVVADQFTAARAYFLCVLGLLFCEGLFQLPGYVRRLRYRGRPPVKTATSHWQLRVAIHRFATFPSLLPLLTKHNFPSLLRLALFIAFNILWGWNRILYTTDFKLYGWLSLSNSGLALLLGARTNLLSLLLRLPSPTLLLYHRWAGRAATLHATLHLGLTAAHYQRTRQLASVLANPQTQAGLVAWCALAVVAATSVTLVRRRCYEAFYYPHALFFVFLAGALVHAPHAPEFLLPGFLLWVADRGVRLWRTGLRSVAVRKAVLYPGGVVKIRVEGGRGGFGSRHVAPGQVAWMQVPGVSFVSWHPFTIASAPREETATFAVRGLGGFTKAVQGLATEAGKAVEMPGSSDRGQETAKKTGVNIRLDGPFGVGSLQWEQYPLIVLVAGGIGITPGISIASHIMRRAASTDSREPTSNRWHIHMLWIIKDARHAMWFEEELARLGSMASASGRATLEITIHISDRGVSPTGITDQEISYEMDQPYTYTGPGNIVRGRPHLLKWFESVKAQRPGLDAATNLCGPRRLIDDARKAAARASGSNGLFHVEEEVFEF